MNAVFGLLLALQHSYYRARYYDPVGGRFISEDPMGFKAGPNFYAYARNNPVNWADPFGLDVTVIQYQGMGPNRFGHIAISVNGSTPVGFDDSSNFWNLPAALDFTVPGAVKPITDPNRPIMDSITIHTTPEQDAAILQYIQNRTKHPGPYNLTGRNCAQFAANSLKSGGLEVPYSILPGTLLNDLHQLYDPKPPAPVSNEIPIGPGVWYNPIPLE